jgi:hypothetical protein
MPVMARVDPITGAHTSAVAQRERAHHGRRQQRWQKNGTKTIEKVATLCHFSGLAELPAISRNRCSFKGVATENFRSLTPWHKNHDCATTNVPRGTIKLMRCTSVASRPVLVNEASELSNPLGTFRGQIPGLGRISRQVV